MNIFFLHMIPCICAQMHCNVHCVKMIIEYAQMLSTAHRVLDGKQVIVLSKNKRKLKRYKMCNEMENILYKSTHVNHPCAIWVRQSSMNYMWLYELFVCLCKEYTKRYKKIHLTEKKLLIVLSNIPKKMPVRSFTSFPKAIPDDVKTESVITSYRNFYCKYKKEIVIWPKGEIPIWFEEKF